MMLGLSGKPESPDGKNIEPKTSHGLQAISIGLFLGEDTPAIWRGPMTTQYLQQLLTTTLWKDLDYLVIDLPPGTGDVQLSLVQMAPVAGAIVVTTPQDLALIDVKKAVRMFEKVGVPILGVIENMSYFLCPHCKGRSEIFGHGGAEETCRRMGLKFLGEVPIELCCGRLRTRGAAGGDCPDAPRHGVVRAAADSAAPSRSSTLWVSA
jgi:ATP-binding protein involved in chromosome partitioning